MAGSSLGALGYHLEIQTARVNPAATLAATRYPLPGTWNLWLEALRYQFAEARKTQSPKG
jgi:hypothetical protein